MASQDSMTGNGSTFGRFHGLNLAITGVAAQYPPYKLEPSVLSVLAKRHYPESLAMKKVLAINEFTGIDCRSAIGSVDHPLANRETAPTIDELNTAFMELAVPLAETAARKAIHEAGLQPSDITHIVSTTCTNSANPGFDHFLCKRLGIKQTVEKVLLHGIGCSGGLATLRTGANLALGNSFRGRRARVLCIAAEISSLLVRSELDSINDLQETRIGVTLFSDCASACVLSNRIEEGDDEEVTYELLGWEHSIVPDSEHDLGFDVHPLGWKVVLSPRVPKLAAASVQPSYNTLFDSVQLPAEYAKPSDFDWALHPGGATILSGVERAVSITPEHMRASYDTYINHGNSSSATIFSVLDKMRTKEMDGMAPGGKPKDYIVGAAFGPGISIEMCMLKRNFNKVRDHGDYEAKADSGLLTPPETESEGSRSGEETEGSMDAETKESVAEAIHDTIDRGDSLTAALNGVDLD